MPVDKEALGIGPARSYLPELESVRGIAVALVVAMHVDGWFAPSIAPGELSPLRALVRAPRLGVDLFFVLSAFLLSMPILAAAAAGTRVDVAEFARRRALRILPLYWAAVAVATLACARTPADLAQGLPYLAFVNGFPRAAVPLEPYSNVWWSLATEAQFYVLLGLGALALRSRSGRMALAIGAVAYAAAYVGYVAGAWRIATVYDSLMLQASVFGRGPLFLAGIAAAEVHRRFGHRAKSALRGHPLAAGGGADVVATLLVAALAAHLFHVATLPRQLVNAPQTTQLSVVVEGTLLGALLLWLMVAPLRLRVLVVNPVLTRLGILSYSIYLLHVPLLVGFVAVVRRLNGLTPGWSAATLGYVALYVAVLVALAEVTFRCVERPFLRRKARLRGAEDASRGTIGPADADDGASRRARERWTADGT